MNSYHAVQQIPEDFSAEPRLVANIIAGRVEYLLDRVIVDGLNPLHGTLSVEPDAASEYITTNVLRFTWTPIE